MARNIVEDVADYFLRSVDAESGSVMTHLKLQKLCYYAQAWHLAWYGTPLFDGDFEAWVHGPVNRTLWNKYKELGFDPIPRPTMASTAELSVKEVSTLQAIWEAYGAFDAKHLENLTHQDAPWREARKGCGPGDPCTVVIDHRAMEEFYGKFT